MALAASGLGQGLLVRIRELAGLGYLDKYVFFFFFISMTYTLRINNSLVFIEFFTILSKH